MPKSAHILLSSADAFGEDLFEVRRVRRLSSKPDGSGCMVVARVLMDEWPRIVAAAKK
jgi:hypothetical protein